MARRFLVLLLLLASALTTPAQPRRLSSSELDDLVSRIALYPDPLLAQVLDASTHWDQVADAAGWADQHSYLKGDALADATKADNLDWDPSVIALLPFPTVLDMMARDMAWTQKLGEAVLYQREDVMDAVQRMRKKAKDYGYLKSDDHVKVQVDAGFVQILPVDPGVIYVPFYDPVVVFSRPAIAGAIRFGPGILIGAAFAPWGWADVGFVWPAHRIIIDRVPWERRWANREVYVHHYEHPWVRRAGPRIERHEVRRR
jgi:hypothetical protein